MGQSRSQTPAPGSLSHAVFQLGSTRNMSPRVQAQCSGALAAPSTETRRMAGTAPRVGGLSPSPVTLAVMRSELSFRGLPGAQEVNVFPLCG